MLGIVSPTAFAEIVETKGQNYDLVENFFIGEAIWNSTPERIMNGGWQNYALSNTADKIIFNTNAVGSFIFDKNSCSYSIYGNGYNGEQIIPSVSAVATYLNNSQWQNLPINDEACIVEVSQYEDGVFLTSTKVITEDIIEDVFLPYTGDSDSFYVNATNSQFTLLTNSTGNIGYFNGETRLLESVEVGKFVQELNLNIYNGFKETFKVTHDGNQELGISQTIHTGESITIGDQTINIAELNGQSFDRQYIMDNEAEILALTDSVSYEFSTGIKSLENVNIIFDGDYKVNMDYANGLDGEPFIGYLEIDPTFTNNPDTVKSVGDTTSGTDCGTGNWETSPTNANIKLWGTGDMGIHDCMMKTFQWDISSIPSTEGSSGSILSSVSYEIEVTSVNNPRTCEINPITNFSDTTANLFTDIQSGTPYASGLTECQSVGTHTISLGSSGLNDVTSALSGGGLFAVGWAYEDMTTTSTERYTYSNLPSLEVVYLVPTVPQPPTGLTTSTGIPIELDWTAPTDNGDSAITGYKVFRTLNEFALTELPDSSGSDSQLTFTNNEFLIHGFPVTDSSTNSITVTDGTSTNEVVWDESTATNASFSGNTITGTGGTWGTASKSIATYSTSDGMEIELERPSGSYSVMFGFGNGAHTGGTYHFSTLDYGINMGGDVYESNSNVCNSCSNLGAGIYKVKIDTSGAVTYWYKSLTGSYTTPFYTSTGTTASGDYSARVHIHTTYSALPEVTAIDPSTSVTDGVIGTGVSPVMVFTSSSLPDNTDDFSIGSWVQIDMRRDSTLDGTNNGATTGVTGKIGNAWDFDGSNDSVEISTLSNLIDQSDGSVSAWINYDSTSNTTFLGSRDSSQNEGWTVRTDGSSRMELLMDGGGSEQLECRGSSSLSSGQWYHLVMSYDYTSGNPDCDMVTFYVNGVSESATAENETITTQDLTHTDSTWIGSQSNLSGFVNGDIDQLIAYDKALSSSEVSALYNSGSGDSTPDTDGMVAHYNFEQTATLENQGLTLPPINAKLLQLNDVNFYVGQTNANVTESYIATTTYSAIPSSSTTAQQCSDWGCTSFTTAYGSTANANDDDFSTSYVLTGSGLNQYIKPIRYDMPYMVSAGADVHIKTEGGSVSGSGIRGAIYQDARNSITGEAYCITYDYAGACSRTTGTVNSACQSSIYSCPFSQTADVTTTVPIDFDYITSKWSTHVGYSSYSVATHYDMEIASYSADSVVDNLIISATIPDTSTEPRHIGFTRSGNDFIIYSQGSSVATATNSISLGSNTGQDYTVNLDGMIDEYFINSDVLTSTEIDDIYERGIEPTLLTTVTANEHDDSTVVGGNTYYYSVKATNAIGDSDLLTPLVSGLAGTPPDPPTGISATIPNTATAPLDVTVSFSPSATVGSGTVTGFQLLRDGVAVATDGLVTSLQDTAPSGGTTYAYTVKALGTHGNSVASASSSVTTPNTPAQVTGLTVTPVSTSRIDLSWNTPSDNNSLISGYKVQISSNGGSSYTDVFTGNVNTVYQSLSLATNSQYHFKVSAINGVGTGTASDVKNTYTMTPTPASLTATPVSEVQINLAWGASTGSTGYKIEFESPNGNGFTTNTENTGNTDLTKSITGLTTGTQYNFRVSGINAGGASVPSPEASSYTWGILQAPVLDTITRLSPTSLKLDFTTGIGLPVATGYKIERQTGTGWIELIADTGNTDTFYSDYVLSSDQTASYRLYAINNIGTSLVSNELTSDVVQSSGGGGGSSSRAVSSQTGVSGLIDLTFIDQIHRVVLGQFLSKSINVAWDSSDNLEVKSIVVSDSPFRIVFQDVPFVLIGDPSGISNGKINYSVQIPSELCTQQGQVNCVEQKQYEVPVEIQSVHKGSTLTKSSVIKIDLAGGSDIPLVFVLLAIGAVPLAFIIRKDGSGKSKRKASGSSHKSSKNGSNSKKVSL
jgi:hypothetical protein